MKNINSQSRWRALVIAIGLLSAMNCWAKEIVLAFDKTLARPSSLGGLSRTSMLVKNMASADVHQAMFLIRTKDITDKTIDRIDYYDLSGQLLVNAGDSFSPYHRQKSFAYPIDVMKANTKLSNYVNYHQHVYLPYLYGYGDTNTQRQVLDFLQSHNYIPTYVTYQAHDDYLDRLYQERLANNRTVDIRRLEKAYVNMQMKDINAYDVKGSMILGYHPRQIILLHENDLTAYSIIGLIDELRAQGYTIVSPEKVFSDPVDNLFYKGEFTAAGYLQSLFAPVGPIHTEIYISSKQDEEKIHGYLREQGLDELITGN